MQFDGILDDFELAISNPLKFMGLIAARLDYFRTGGGNPSVTGAEGPKGCIATDKISGQLYQKLDDGFSINWATLNVTASTRGTVVEATGNKTLLYDENFCIVTSATDCTITLPLISSVLEVVSGKTISHPFTIKRFGAGKVTVAIQGPDNIDGDPSVIMKFAKESISLLPSSAGWGLI